MNARKISEAAGTQTFVLVFNTGDEVTKGLLEFARAHKLEAASLTGIGAFQNVIFEEWAHHYYAMRDLASLM